MPAIPTTLLGSPSTQSWAEIVKTIDASSPDAAEVKLIKQQLQRWPRELPRPAPKHWLGEDGSFWHKDTQKSLLELCLEVTEVDTYDLYIKALADEPRLRLSDGMPAVSLHRQQRGTVETMTGRKVTMNGDVPGFADLGGTLTLEWGNSQPFYVLGEKAPHTISPFRIQLYIEIEVKLDGKIPPQAREYKGTSRRQPSKTEHEQVQRQQAQLARGGFYIFADRVANAVEAVVAYRDEVLRRIRR